MPVATLLPLSSESHDDVGYDTDTDATVFAVLRNDDLTDEANHLVSASQAGNTPRSDWYVDALVGAAAVGNVDATWYVRASGGEDVGMDLYDGTTTDVIYDAAGGGSPSNYVDRTFTGVDQPTASDPAAWTPAHFKGAVAGSAVMGFYSSSNLAGSVFCTYARMSVTYTPPAGGFMYLVGCWAAWLAPHVGAVVAGDIAPALATLRIRPTKEEVLAVVEALKVRPSYV